MTTPEQKIKVLLIEDETLDQKMVERALSRSSVNFDLTILAEPEHFFSKGKFSGTIPHDVIILDYNFPQSVSSNLLHLLKKFWCTDIPIIVLTGTDSQTLKSNVEAYNNVFYKLKEERTYETLATFIFETIGNSVSLKAQSSH